MTAYLILYNAIPAGPGEEAYRVLDEIEADTSEQAIRNYVKNVDNGNKSGTYAAVPQRSWRPVEISVERTERVVFTHVG